MEWGRSSIILWASVLLNLAIYLLFSSKTSFGLSISGNAAIAQSLLEANCETDFLVVSILPNGKYPILKPFYFKFKCKSVKRTELYSCMLSIEVSWFCLRLSIWKNLLSLDPRRANSCHCCDFWNCHWRYWEVLWPCTYNINKLFRCFNYKKCLQ